MYICWSYEWILVRSLVVAQRFQAQLVRFYSFFLSNQVELFR